MPSHNHVLVHDVPRVSVAVIHALGSDVGRVLNKKVASLCAFHSARCDTDADRRRESLSLTPEGPTISVRMRAKSAHCKASACRLYTDTHLHVVTQNAEALNSRHTFAERQKRCAPFRRKCDLHLRTEECLLSCAYRIFRVNGRFEVEDTLYSHQRCPVVLISCTVRARQFL